MDLQGTHYIAIGEHADLWEGTMYNRKVTLVLGRHSDVSSQEWQVAVKVLRGGSSSNPEFLAKFKEVSPDSQNDPVSSKGVLEARNHVCNHIVAHFIVRFWSSIRN